MVILIIKFIIYPISIIFKNLNDNKFIKDMFLCAIIVMNQLEPRENCKFGGSISYLIPEQLD